MGLGKAPGGFGWWEPNSSLQGVLEAKRTSRLLACIRHGIVSHSKEGIDPPYSVLVQPHLKCYVQFWAPQCKKDVKILECVHRRATNIGKGLAGTSF